MLTRYFAGLAGIVYLVVGILAFIPFFRSSPPVNAPHLAITAAYGYFLGHFPVNVIHDLGNILIGIWGLIAFARLGWSEFYARFLAILFGILTVMGFVPHSDVLWGLAPIFGTDTWVHLVTALLAAYFGWVALAPTYVPAAEGHAAH